MASKCNVSFLHFYITFAKPCVMRLTEHHHKLLAKNCSACFLMSSLICANFKIYFVFTALFRVMRGIASPFLVLSRHLATFKHLFRNAKLLI